MSDRIVRIDSPDDPERCQLNTKHGQCQNKRAPDAQYCHYHNGYMQEANAERKRISNYHVARYQARLEKQANSPELKSLRDEIALLRILIEDRLNACRTDTDLILQSGPISDLIMKVDKVVNSCHRLEANLGNLLDKTDLIQFASEVINILSEMLDQQQMLDVANKIERLFDDRTHSSDADNSQ